MTPPAAPEVEVERIDLSKLKPGMEFQISVRATSTGAYRLRASFGMGEVRHEVLDRVLPFGKLALVLHEFIGENLAGAVLRAQAAGAGQEM